MGNTNTDVLAEYREQKKSLEKLVAGAKKAAQGRYVELLTEAATIQKTFKEDFGTNPDLPPTVKTFTVNVDGNGKKPAAEPAAETSDGRKIGGLKRSLNSAIAKGDAPRVAELSKQLAELGVTVGTPAPAETPAVEAEEAVEAEPAVEPEAELEEEMFPVG